MFIVISQSKMLFKNLENHQNWFNFLDFHTQYSSRKNNNFAGVLLKYSAFDQNQALATK